MKTHVLEFESKVLCGEPYILSESLLKLKKKKKRIDRPFNVRLYARHCGKFRTTGAPPKRTSPPLFSLEQLPGLSPNRYLSILSSNSNLQFGLHPAPPPRSHRACPLSASPSVLSLTSYPSILSIFLILEESSSLSFLCQISPQHCKHTMLSALKLIQTRRPQAFSTESGSKYFMLCRLCVSVSQLLSGALWCRGNIDNTQTCRHVCVPINFYLQRQAGFGLML